MLSTEDTFKTAPESQPLKELDSDPLSPISMKLFRYGKKLV